MGRRSGAALTALWGEGLLPMQRCTVHRHRHLLAHAAKHMHGEVSADYRDMIHACSAVAGKARRKAFLSTWHLKCRAPVADSLEEAGEGLFCVPPLDPAPWRWVGTTIAIERLNEEFRRRIKTQPVLPCAETMAMLLWALLASGQIQVYKIQMHGVDDWATFSQPIQPIPLDCPA